MVRRLASERIAEVYTGQRDMSELPLIANEVRALERDVSIWRNEALDKHRQEQEAIVERNAYKQRAEQAERGVEGLVPEGWQLQQAWYDYELTEFTVRISRYGRVPKALEGTGPTIEQAVRDAVGKVM